MLMYFFFLGWLSCVWFRACVFSLQCCSCLCFALLRPCLFFPSVVLFAYWVLCCAPCTFFSLIIILSSFLLFVLWLSAFGCLSFVISSTSLYPVDSLLSFLSSLPFRLFILPSLSSSFFFFFFPSPSRHLLGRRQAEQFLRIKSQEQLAELASVHSMAASSFLSQLFLDTIDQRMCVHAWMNETGIECDREWNWMSRTKEKRIGGSFSTLSLRLLLSSHVLFFPLSCCDFIRSAWGGRCDSPLFFSFFMLSWFYMCFLLFLCQSLLMLLNVNVRSKLMYWIHCVMLWKQMDNSHLGSLLMI